ncbi:hypothetical protein bcgnr5390_09310 [Bacillus luti]
MYLLACVKSSMGVAIMMKSILKGHEHDLSFNPLPNNFKKVPTTFITRKDINHSAALQKFMELTHNA